MNPLFVKWVSERFLHGLIYCVIILSIGFILYKLFIAPTNTTNVADGGKIINITHSDQGIDVFPLIGCSAYRIRTDVYWKKAPKEKNK